MRAGSNIQDDHSEWEQFRGNLLESSDSLGDGVCYRYRCLVRGWGEVLDRLEHTTVFLFLLQLSASRPSKPKSRHTLALNMALELWKGLACRKVA